MNEEINLFLNGQSIRLWEVLGSHVHGNTTTFSVWAPNALEVKVNDWHMTRGDGGVWSVTVPQDLTGLKYMYNILNTNGEWVTKFDPMSRANSIHPDRHAVVYTSTHEWQDSTWVANRQGIAALMSIYEVHLNSWKKGETYLSLIDTLLPHVKSLGFTHIQIMPIADYPFTPSWGYQVTGFYAPSAFFGNPDDLKRFIDACHQDNIGVILDWVPYHFPVDSFALRKYDGTNLYEYQTDEEILSNEWGTAVFNWAKPEVRSFLLSNANYWISEFHFDGLRVDAIAPILDRKSRVGGRVEYPLDVDTTGVEFLRSLNYLVHQLHPNVITIAEDSNEWVGMTHSSMEPDGIGFDLTLNMGSGYEMPVCYLPGEDWDKAPQYPHMVARLSNAYTDKQVWEISHDTVHHGCEGSVFGKIANEKLYKAYLTFLAVAPGKMMLFMGSELGSTRLWNPEGELEWGLPNEAEYHKFLSVLLSLRKERPELYENEFDAKGLTWVVNDAAYDNVIAFTRNSLGSSILCIFNFSSEDYSAYPVPIDGSWSSVFSSDGLEYRLTNGSLDLPAGLATLLVRD